MADSTAREIAERLGCGEHREFCDYPREPCSCDQQARMTRSESVIATALADAEARVRQEMEAATERADLAEAYMAGMRAACGQPPADPNGEPYRKGRFNFQYQEGFTLAKELLDVFARRTDKAQERADVLSARLATSEQELKDWTEQNAPSGWIDNIREALKELRINANRLCDRNLGGTYEEDCRRSIAKADAALRGDPR